MCKKIMLLLVGCLLPLGAAGQVYQAGLTEEKPETVARWEVSLGWTRTDVALRDARAKVVSNADGFSLRGLYYPVKNVGLGVEGTWFSDEHFAGNTYRQTQYGAVAKWILTPETVPGIYVLAGGGTTHRKLSYSGWFSRTSHSAYGLLGLGIELPLAAHVSVAAEAYGVYNQHRRADDFLTLRHRWEKVFSLRGAIRF